jgi:hypothetical protein
MKEIQLTQGKIALVDDADYEGLNKFKWHAVKAFNTYYAQRNVRKEGKDYTIYMHRSLLQAEQGVHVDHRNRKGLDNQRHNLRTAYCSENLSNRGKNRNNSVGFKGVYLKQDHVRSKPYVARIKVNYDQKYLGYYATPEEAARAYDEAAKLFHGEFACLNFPEGS